MLQDYRNAVAGAAITIATWAAANFAGVAIPAEVGAAAVTVAVFGLGFIPKSAEPTPTETDEKP